MVQRTRKYELFNQKESTPKKGKKKKKKKHIYLRADNLNSLELRYRTVGLYNAVEIRNYVPFLLIQFFFIFLGSCTYLFFSNKTASMKKEISPLKIEKWGLLLRYLQEVDFTFIYHYKQHTCKRKCRTSFRKTWREVKQGIWKIQNCIQLYCATYCSIFSVYL